MKKFIVCALSALALAACHQQPTLIINASGNADAEGYAYFKVLGSDEKLDSALITDGAFRMELSNLNPAEVYSLTIPSLHMKECIFAEEGELQLNMAEDVLTGTPLAEQLAADLMRFGVEYMKATSEEELLPLIHEIVSTHSEDITGAACLYYLGLFLPAEEALTLYEGAADVVKNATCLKKIAPVWQTASATSVGRPYTDFEVVYNGDTARLSDYVGGDYQLTLVDFWASWCGPCKREIPTLIDLYNRYHSQGLQVVGVATWDEPAATLAAIEKLGIPYPQILNAQRIGSDAYGIQGIPQILLIAADGTILARDLRCTAIEQAILAALEGNNE